MNSHILIQEMLSQTANPSLDRGLSDIWNRVWDDHGKMSYQRLRSYKVIDKVAKLGAMGVELRQKHVIDIGCGDGTLLAYLHDKFNATGCGIDISQNAINAARSNARKRRMRFDIADHRNLNGLKSSQFDIAFSFGVIEHFEDYMLALAEARRVLKPGGKIVLIQPHLLSFGVLQRLFLQLVGRWRFGDQKDFSCFRYVKLMRQAGFAHISYRTYPPYSDMKTTRFFDVAMKAIIPFWGHYLYIVGEKQDGN